MAVVGGQKIGCEVAEFIADKGSNVALTDPTDTFCQDSGQKIRWLLMERLENESKIEMRIKTTVEKIEETSITVQKEGSTEQIDGIDMVVLCMGKVSTNELADQLKADAKVPEIYLVGDCIRPRKITEAVAEGAAVGHQI